MAVMTGAHIPDDGNISDIVFSFWFLRFTFHASRFPEIAGGTRKINTFINIIEVSELIS
jgi:hypothetical protein